VLLVMTDDVGFGAASTFGGPVPTPNLDALARHGLRFNRFHTTAVCSATRAALLTGRNHHAVGAGAVADLATGYPGYSNTIPRSAATVAEVLRLNGYNTAMFGKHHNVQPGAGSAAGPFDQWPTGLGFEYFYGFVRAETDQFAPILYRGTDRIDPPKGEVLDQMLVDDAIRWIHNQQAAAPDKPFFLYLAPGTAHGPQQAPAEWIAKFRGQFDRGWDDMRQETLRRQIAMGVVPKDTHLAPRPPGVPAWDSLSPDEKKVAARLMEVFAGMLACQDAQFGRLVAELQRMGKLDNTLVLFIEGDNGGSAEGGLSSSSNWIAGFANGSHESAAELVKDLDKLGGPDSYPIYPVGWAMAMNAPFPWMKKIASHLGGTRNGLVVSWPGHIVNPGSVRSQFHHVIDIAPTILEAARVPAADVVDGAPQQRFDGVSMAYSFMAPAAPDRRTTQYFEMQGTRALYDHGWLASTTPRKAPWMMTNPPGSPVDYKWELYDLTHDFSQSRDIARRNPAKLAELKALFDREARANGVFPLDDRESYQRASAAQAVGMDGREFTYWGADVSVTDDVAPPLRRRSFSLVAEVEIPVGGGSGVLAAYGGHFAGWSFFMRGGRPVVHHAVSQLAGDQFEVAAGDVLPAGRATIRFDFNRDSAGPGSGGTVRISAGGRELAVGRIARTAWTMAGLGETFDVGRDTGDPVVEGSAPFNGVIRKLTVLPR
jgi:arylsulfatase